MNYKFNEEYELSAKDYYLFNPKHRTPSSSHASIWTVPQEEELKLADEGISLFSCKETAFNVKRELNRLYPLGYNSKRTTLFLAKFVMSFVGRWHGYPADHVMNNQDKPSQGTLKKMVEASKLSKKEMRCIGKGQRI